MLKKLCKRYTEKMNIKIDINIFEHILNCMCNQKYINEQKKEIQKQWQKIIDIAWNKGMRILTDNQKKE